MTKTLRITSIIVMVLVAVVILVVFPAVVGIQTDEKIDQFLNSPGATEKFTRARGSKVKDSKSRTSPLIKQARAFALYLNPPPKTVSKRTPTSRKPAVAAHRPSTVSSKFTLIGTSFYQVHPELSLALIDQPGKGLHWVKQSAKVGHLIIEQVKDGLVVVRDGQRTFELPVAERPKKKSLLKGHSSGKTGRESILSILTKSGIDIPIDKRSQISPQENNITAAEPPPVSPQVTADKPLQPAQSPEEAAMLNDLVSELRAVQMGGESSETNPEAVNEKSTGIIEKFFTGLEAVRVSDEEAQRLGRLGRELKDYQQDPNRPKNGKIEKPKTPPKRRKSRK